MPLHLHLAARAMSAGQFSPAGAHTVAPRLNAGVDVCGCVRVHLCFNCCKRAVGARAALNLFACCMSVCLESAPATPLAFPPNTHTHTINQGTPQLLEPLGCPQTPSTLHDMQVDGIALNGSFHQTMCKAVVSGFTLGPGEVPAIHM